MTDNAIANKNKKQGLPEGYIGTVFGITITVSMVVALGGVILIAYNTYKHEALEERVSTFNQAYHDQALHCPALMAAAEGLGPFSARFERLDTAALGQWSKDVAQALQAVGQPAVDRAAKGNPKLSDIGKDYQKIVSVRSPDEIDLQKFRAMTSSLLIDLDAASDGWACK